MTELSDAHSLFIQSEIGIAQAKADYRVALSRLELVEGLKGQEALPKGATGKVQ